MSIARSSRALTAGLVAACLVTTLVIAVGVGSTMQRFALVNGAQLARELLSGAERDVAALTNASRGYTITGLEDYRAGFRAARERTARLRTATPRDTALAAAEMRQLQAALQHALALEVLGQQAIERAAAQDRPGAMALAWGTAHAAAEQDFAVNLGAARGAFEKRIAARLAQLNFRARASAALALALLLLTIGAMLATLRLFVRRRLVAPLVELARRAEQAGQIDQDLACGFERDRGELGRLARALETLRRAHLESERERRLKARINEIADRLQGAGGSADFARELLSCLSTELPMLAGALFQRPVGEPRFLLAGSFGIARGAAHEAGFAEGEGMAGQAAAERRELRLRELPPAYRPASGAAAALRPSVALLLPLISGETVVGVLELLLLREPAADQEQLLQEVAQLLAPRLEALQRSEHAARLLEAARLQGSRMAVLEQELAQLKEAAAQGADLPIAAESRHATLGGGHRARAS